MPIFVSKNQLIELVRRQYMEAFSDEVNCGPLLMSMDSLDGKSWSSGVRLIPKVTEQEVPDDKSKRLVAELFRVTEELKQSVKE